MPTLRVPPDLDLHYLVDGYIDPWRSPPPAMTPRYAD
jgi:hypothetical protein